jgi:hypothetical protein
MREAVREFRPDLCWTDPAGTAALAGRHLPVAETSPSSSATTPPPRPQTSCPPVTSPASATGYGPLDPDTTRALACAAAGHHATRWHLTVTSPGGQAVGHGRAPARQTTPAHSGSGSGWTVTVTAGPITSPCEHRTREPGYRPSPALHRLI